MRKSWLMSTAAFAPPGEGGEPNEGETDVQETVPGDEGEDEGLGEDAGAEEGQDGAEEDAEGDGEGSVDPEPRRPSRAQSRIQSLAETVRTEKAERQRIERELSELRAAQQQRERQNQQESPEARAARRALMDPTEVMREDMRESEQRTAHQLHQLRMENQEANDRSSYNTILRDAPHLKKYDGEVEKIRLEQQAKGMFVPREVLLDLAIGRAARAAATRQAPKAKKEGQRRIEGQQSRPAQARGDTGTQRGRQGDSVEKRLENVPI